MRSLVFLNKLVNLQHNSPISASSKKLHREDYKWRSRRRNNRSLQAFRTTVSHISRFIRSKEIDWFWKEVKLKTNFICYRISITTNRAMVFTWKNSLYRQRKVSIILVIAIDFYFLVNFISRKKVCEVVIQSN